MTTFVFVHGGAHGSWCWQRILGPLRQDGHAVNAVDLPGRRGTAGVELADHLDAIASAVHHAEPPVVLVSHSIGGAIASQFLEHRPDAVAGAVLLNALLVEDGEAVLAKVQSIGEECLLLREGALRFSEDASTVSIAPGAAVEGFYNCCAFADAAWAAAQLCPEPVAPLLVPLKISAGGFGAVPKIYLGSRDDHVLPWWMQERMATAAGAPLVEIDGDHSPFLSTPNLLVRHLLSIEADWNRA